MFKFLASIAALCAGIVVFIYFGIMQHWITMPSHAWKILAFLTISTIGIFGWLNSHSNNQTFTQVYLLSIVCKLLTYGVFILLIIFSDRPGAALNAGFFIAVYFAFTAVEVGFLFKKINR